MSKGLKLFVAVAATVVLGVLIYGYAVYDAINGSPLPGHLPYMMTRHTGRMDRGSVVVRYEVDDAEALGRLLERQGYQRQGDGLIWRQSIARPPYTIVREVEIRAKPDLRPESARQFPQCGAAHLVTVETGYWWR